MTSSNTRVRAPFPSSAELRGRVQALGLWGVDVNWDELKDEKWIVQLVEVEVAERARRSDRGVASVRVREGRH